MAYDIKGVEMDKYVPGVMYCAKCNFRLIRTNLHIQNGSTSAGDNRTEPCPNGCGPMWPVTWEKEAREAIEQVEKYFDEIQRLEAEVERLRETLPEDVRQFIYRITLDLQGHRLKTEKQLDNMFQQAYRLYEKYDVEGLKRKDNQND